MKLQVNYIPAGPLSVVLLALVVVVGVGEHVPLPSNYLC